MPELRHVSRDIGQRHRRPSLRGFIAGILEYMGGGARSDPHPLSPADDEFDAVAIRTFQSLCNVPEEVACTSAELQAVQLANDLLVHTLASGSRELQLPGSQQCTPGDLKCVIDELPADTQRVLGMHVAQSLSYREVATQLGVAPEVALTVLKDAYSQLRLRTSGEQFSRL